VEAIHKKGFSFVEILAPCPTAFGRRNKVRKPVDLLRMYYERSVVKNGLDPNQAVIDFNQNLVLGKFVDRTRSTFLDNYGLINRKVLGDWPGLEHETLLEGKEKAGAGQ